MAENFILAAAGFVFLSLSSKEYLSKFYMEFKADIKS